MLNAVPMEAVIAHSFTDYHVKGFHYICLKRSPQLTDKLYFFDGDVSALPEVVAPHDHRYDFSTLCIKGQVENRWYEEVALDSGGVRYQHFAYKTPLNGGHGFTWTGESELALLQAKCFGAGRRYFMFADEIHTIQLRESGTILRLRQYEDVVPVDVPSSTFTLNREPPSLSGLYNKPKADDVRRLLSLLPSEIDVPTVV